MNFIKKYALVSILLIVLAIICFYFFYNNQGIDVFCLTKVNYSLVESEETSLIFQTLTKNIGKSVNVNFTSDIIFDGTEIDDLKSDLERKNYDLFFLDLAYSDNLLQHKAFNNIETNIFTLFFKKTETLKNAVNILPDLDQVSAALNEFCDLTSDSVILVLDEYQLDFDFSEKIPGNIFVFAFKETVAFKENINEFINLIEDYDPDYLFLNTNESNTIKILDSIVGFPREKIFLMLQNTNKKVVYYTGTNAYGVNGITITDTFDSDRFSNKMELYRMFSKSIAEYIGKYGNYNMEEWIEWQNEALGKKFIIDENQLYTTLYHVEFDESGMHVIDEFVIK